MQIKTFGKYGTVYNEKFETVLPTIESGSVDCVIIDPPYVGYNGKNPVLAGHKIQTVIDLDLVCSEAFRVLKPNSFFAFFGQMPTIIDWYAAAKKAGFEWKIQIIWNKKNGNIRQLGQLENITELIWVLKKGNPKFNKVNAPYEEQVRMNIDNGSKVDTIFKELSYWKGIAQGKELVNVVQPNKQRNDKIYDRGIYERTSKVLGSETKNIKNIWAYSSHNLECRTEIGGGKIKHPSVKPIPLLERLIELLTFEGATVLDCFIGSGTTALAGIRTKRKVIGVELFEDYFDITCNRIEKEIKLQEQNLF